MKKSELQQIIREEISKVLKELSDSEIQVVDLKDVQSLITRTAATKYPEIKLYFEQDDYIYVSTDKEEPSAASMWGEGKRGQYYLTINLYVEGSTLNLVVGNATAGKYKGMTGDIIKALFDFGVKKYSPIKEKVLVIEDDRSDGYWQTLAQKLGVTYEAQ